MCHEALVSFVGVSCRRCWGGVESISISYPKQGDFRAMGHLLFEVGGPGKSFDQVADLPNRYLAVDDLEVGRGARIPLWLFGLLY